MHSKVWMFSHLIDDEDLAFLQREFISYQQAMEYYGLRYKPVVRIAKTTSAVNLGIGLAREGKKVLLVDTDPQGSLTASLGMMTINALVASDSVLIPVQAAYLPVKGLQQLIKTILMVKKRLNRGLEIQGILLTMVDYRTNYAKDIAAKLHETYGSRITIFNNSIPMSVKAAETSAEGVSIYSHCPKSKVAEAYRNLTQEVLNSEK